MIKVYLNRKVSETQITIGNQYESGVNAIDFDLSELKEKWPNGNIYLLVSRKEHTWPYSIDDGEFKIEYVLTWKRGFYQMNVVVTDEKIIDQLESSNTIFVSDTINAYVNENQINAKALNEQELPRELQIVYDDLITLKKNIEKDLADGKYIGPQGPKGEKGDPGDVTEEYRNLASQIAQNASDAQTSATNAQKILDDTKEFANQTKTELNQIKTDTSALKDEANTSAVNAKASEDKAKEYADNLQASTDDISKLKEDLVELSNLEKPEIEFTITGYFASDGHHIINEYFKSTDFVELVKDGIYIPLRYHLNGSNLQEILIYNKEKRVIKAIPLSPTSHYQALDGVLEFEKGFYYAKFCSYSVDFDYWVKFDTIRNQIPYESLKDGMIPRHEISMEKLTGMIHDPSTNFINPLDVNKGYVNNDGEFVENSTWHNTGLIKLESGGKYYWSGFYHKYYAFYDKNFKVVLKSTNSLPNPFIVPESAMYGLFSMAGDFSGCWIHNINEKPADYAECLNVKNIYALGKKQGVENAGKILSINNEGNIVPIQLKKESETSTKI